MKVVETLEYGYSLVETDDGNQLVLTPDAELIGMDEYADIVERKTKNKLDWFQIDHDELEDIISRAVLAVELVEDVDKGDPTIYTILIGGVAEEGDPFFIRINSFQGADTIDLANTSWNRLLWSIGQHRPEKLLDVEARVEEYFGTTEQTGFTGVSDRNASEHRWLTKVAIKDGWKYKLSWLNGELVSVKKDKKVINTSKSNGIKGYSELRNTLARAKALGLM